MSTSKTPILQLPTSDYEQMRSMNNRRLINVLRTAVLAPDRMTRFSPRPPAEHDAYVVIREVDSICVRLLMDGQAVFSCVFLPVNDEY